MDITRWLITSGTLGALGFLSTLITSLLLGGLIRSSSFGIILGIVLIVASLAFFFLAFFRNDDRQSRSNYLTVAVPALLGGMTACFLTSEWQITASSVNRSVIYILITFPLMGLLSYLWPFVTNFVIRDTLDSNSIDRNKEITLYIWSNAITALVDAFVIGASTEGNTVDLFNDAVVYSIGIWFLGLLVSFGIGTLIANKSSSNAALYDKVQEPAAPVQ